MSDPRHAASPDCLAAPLHGAALVDGDLRVEYLFPARCPSGPCGVWLGPRVPRADSVNPPTYLADDLTVGALMRWLDRQIAAAGREEPINPTVMVALLRLADDLERAHRHYRQSVNP